MTEQKREEPLLTSVYILPCVWASPKSWCPNPKHQGVLKTQQLHHVDGVSMGTTPENQTWLLYPAASFESSLPYKHPNAPRGFVFVDALAKWSFQLLPAWDFDPQNTFRDDIYNVSVETFSLTKNLANYSCPKVTQGLSWNWVLIKSDKGWVNVVYIWWVNVVHSCQYGVTSLPWQGTAAHDVRKPKSFTLSCASM